MREEEIKTVIIFNDFSITFSQLNKLISSGAIVKKIEQYNSDEIKFTLYLPKTNETFNVYIKI